MKRLLIITLCLLSSILKGQDLEKLNKQLEKNWNGVIVLNDGHELNCAFTYNPLIPGGLLIVKTDSLTNIYAPEKVQSFSFFDDESKCQRNFFSLPFKIEERDKHFFELLHQTDQISILGSNTIKNKSTRANEKLFGGLAYEVALKKNDHSPVTRTNLKSAYTKYLLDHRDNTIYSLSKNELLRMVDDRIDLINLFVSQKHLELNKKNIEDYIAVVNFYSSLKTNP